MSRGGFSSFDSFFMEPMPELEPRDSSLFANISNVQQRYMFQDIGEWKKVMAVLLINTEQTAPMFGLWLFLMAQILR